MAIERLQGTHRHPTCHSGGSLMASRGGLGRWASNCCATPMSTCRTCCCWPTDSWSVKVRDPVLLMTQHEGMPAELQGNWVDVGTLPLKAMECEKSMSEPPFL